MFTASDRKELIEIFDDMEKEASELLETDNVIPDSILLRILSLRQFDSTNNGAKVGITIEFRKLYAAQQTQRGDLTIHGPPTISNASE